MEFRASKYHVTSLIELRPWDVQLKTEEVTAEGTNLNGGVSFVGAMAFLFPSRELLFWGDWLVYWGR